MDNARKHEWNRCLYIPYGRKQKLWNVIAEMGYFRTDKKKKLRIIDERKNVRYK